MASCVGKYVDMVEKVSGNDPRVFLTGFSRRRFPLITIPLTVGGSNKIEFYVLVLQYNPWIKNEAGRRRLYVCDSCVIRIGGGREAYRGKRGVDIF